jgi:hypothetical protein
MFPETPDSSYSHDKNLKDNLVHFFQDEVHSQDMANGLAVMPKSENSR